MATQAKRTMALVGFPLNRLCGLGYSAMGTGPIRHADWVAVVHADQIINTQIAIAAKVLVQLKNLYRLKGSLRPCLDDTNTLQHLLLPGELLHTVRCFYCESEPVKESTGKGLSLSRLHHIVEATSPVRNKKEEHNADHSIHYEQ